MVPSPRFSCSIDRPDNGWPRSSLNRLHTMNWERLSVIFVLPDMQLGGAVTSTRLLCQTLIATGCSVSTLILGSRSDAAWVRFSDIGITLADPADLATADLVVLCFWNTPAVHSFIRAKHPPMRVALRPYVEGNLPPHVVTSEVAAFADVIWASASSTLDNRNVTALPRRLLQLPRDFSDFLPSLSYSRREFVAGYLGTVDFIKLHQHYVPMSAAAGEDTVFELWGPGSAGPRIQSQAQAAGRGNDFRVMGTTGKPVETLRRFDVFGYPLCADSYSANDATLQEAMAAGLPCVVLDHPGNRDLVSNGESALVTDSPEAYSNALGMLRRSPELRARIGANAAKSIRQFYSSRSNDDLLDAVSEALSKPKRARQPHESIVGGAKLFVLSLGEHAGAFRRSLGALRQEADYSSEDDEEIAASSPGLCNAGAGGLFNYRARYPEDPVLRYWTALVFARMGRPAVAFAEFQAARRNGLSQNVVGRHLQKLEMALFTDARSGQNFLTDNAGTMS
jgi:glycosyltransferase involved in cell wall biosynthesis